MPLGCLGTDSWLLKIFCPEVATGLWQSLQMHTGSKALCWRFQQLTLYVRPPPDSIFSHHPESGCLLGPGAYIFHPGSRNPASASLIDLPKLLLCTCHPDSLEPYLKVTFLFSCSLPPIYVSSFSVSSCKKLLSNQIGLFVSWKCATLFHIFVCYSFCSPTWNTSLTNLQFTQSSWFQPLLKDCLCYSLGT